MKGKPVRAVCPPDLDRGEQLPPVGVLRRRLAEADGLSADAVPVGQPLAGIPRVVVVASEPGRRGPVCAVANHGFDSFRTDASASLTMLAEPARRAGRG